jgi:hypothetical protein
MQKIYIIILLSVVCKQSIASNKDTSLIFNKTNIPIGVKKCIVVNEKIKGAQTFIVAGLIKKGVVYLRYTPNKKTIKHTPDQCRDTYLNLNGVMCSETGGITGLGCGECGGTQKGVQTTIKIIIIN